MKKFQVQFRKEKVNNLYPIKYFENGIYKKLYFSNFENFITYFFEKYQIDDYKILFETEKQTVYELIIE